MSEYEFLRKEMLECYNSITQYNITLYTAVAAVLTFVLKEKSFVYCLIPYIVILPLYFACESKARTICKIAAYMNVFLEGNEYNWERRHHKFDEQNCTKRNWKSIFQYYFLSIVCSVTAIIKILLYNYKILTMHILIFVVILATLAVLALMKINTINYIDCRNRMIANWEQIKREIC